MAKKSYPLSKAYGLLEPGPVVMVSTEGSQAKVLEAVQLGAAGYVRKPFNADQIKEKLAAFF